MTQAVNTTLLAARTMEHNVDFLLSTATSNQHKDEDAVRHLLIWIHSMQVAADRLQAYVTHAMADTIKESDANELALRQAAAEQAGEYGADDNDDFDGADFEEDEEDEERTEA